jgi:hypothetical protein
MRDKDNKGELNGKCNTSCQKPNSTWYNHSTQKYYCALVQKRLNNDISISLLLLICLDMIYARLLNKIL